MKMLSGYMLIAAMVTAIGANAQQQASGQTNVPMSCGYMHDLQASVPSPTVFRFIEEMPRFNGDLNRFIKDNLHYPDSCRVRGEEGRVILRFIVDTSGMIRRPEILRSSTFRELDQEAMRLIRLMELRPYWRTGKSQGKVVSVEYTLPVTFRLE